MAVADNRPAFCRAVNAQLVGAAGHRLEREPGEVPVSGSPHHPPVGDRRQSVRVGLHPPAALIVEPAERQIDGTLIRVWRALNHAPVGLANLAVLEQKSEVRQRLAMAAEH
jgi:hypothetical protein